MKKTKKPVIFLPTTPEAFDSLIDRLIKVYKLSNKEHASAVVATRIMHLPPDQAACTLEYLGHCVMKNMAYQVAEHQSKTIQHRMQVDQLIAMLKSNPDDQQTVDLLEQAILDGSTYAKEKLDRFREGPDYLKIVTSHDQALVDEVTRRVAQYPNVPLKKKVRSKKKVVPGCA